MSRVALLSAAVIASRDSRNFVRKRTVRTQVSSPVSRHRAVLLSNRTFLSLLVNVTAACSLTRALRRSRVEKGIAELLTPAMGNAQPLAISTRHAVVHQNIRTIDVPRRQA